MKPAWEPCFSRGDVLAFHISRVPHIQTNGERYEFVLRIVCEDEREVSMSVATVEGLAELAVTLLPARVQVSDAAAAKAIDSALAATAQCNREIAKALAAAG